jgi:hypothetical protein
VAAREERRSLPIPKGVTAYYPIARDRTTGLPLHPADIYDAIWGELTDCLSPRVCPLSDLDRVREKAASAFGCPVDHVDAARRRDARREKTRDAMRPDGRFMAVSLPEHDKQLSFYTTLSMMGLAQGDASVILRAETASFFQVAGCDRWGLVACATANRSVRSATTTYENTEDRVCLWGDTVRDYP